jgi:hypothetical protein
LLIAAAFCAYVLSTSEVERTPGRFGFVVSRVVGDDDDGSWDEVDVLSCLDGRSRDCVDVDIVASFTAA